MTDSLFYDKDFWCVFIAILVLQLGVSIIVHCVRKQRAHDAKELRRAANREDGDNE